MIKSIERRRSVREYIDKYVVGIITLGYANEAPKARPRKALEEIIHYETW